MTGWIKFHRKIIDNPIFLKPELFQLFCYCLLRANHKDERIIWNGKEEILEKGSFITGRKVISIETAQNESSIYRRLKILEKLQMLSLKSNNKFSIVKVLNYCIYQGQEEDERTTSEQPANNQRTTTEQPANTDKNTKNVKNDKKIIYSATQFNPPTIEEIKRYCLERSNDVDPEKWHDFYSSKGWMIGKNKMKDWQAAVRTWEHKENQINKPKKESMNDWR